MSDVKRLRAVRAAHRGWVSRTLPKIDTILDAGVQVTLASPVALLQLTLHKQNLEAKFPLLQDQDGKIVEALSDPDEIEADIPA